MTVPAANLPLQLEVAGRIVELPEQFRVHVRLVDHT